MVRKLFKKPERCKTCYDFLSAENTDLGFCKECAAKEIPKLKKRILISSIIGVILVILAFSAIYYARSNFIISDRRGSEGDVFIPTFLGYLGLNIRAFNAMTNLSVAKRIFLGLVCFLAPFGSYIQLEIHSFRRKTETELYSSEPISGNIAAKAGVEKIDDISLFIVSLILSALSGPFFFLYRPYKLVQLSNYLK